MTPEERFWNRRRLAQTLAAIAALWAVAALLTLFGGWRSSAGARAAGVWTPVEGSVTDVSVAGVEQAGRVSFTVPAVRVAFDYTYSDRAYSGDRLRADREPLSPASAAGRAWLAQAPGDTITVYVNPTDPTQAVLDRATTGRWLPNGLLLLALAGVSGALAWVVDRRNRI